MAHGRSWRSGLPRPWRSARSATPIRVALVAAFVAGCGVSDLLPSPQPTFDANPPVGWAWHDSPADHRGAIGQQFDYVCPPDGGIRDIWGTGIYSDDSSVCTAAVHMGMLTRETGGRVSGSSSGRARRPMRGASSTGSTSSETGPWDGELRGRRHVPGRRPCAEPMSSARSTSDRQLIASVIRLADGG